MPYVQSLPENTQPSTTDERQPSLGLGPTGVVHKGGVPWHKRLALTTAPSPTAHHVLLTLGSFVSDGQSGRLAVCGDAGEHDGARSPDRTAGATGA